MSELNENELREQAIARLKKKTAFVNYLWTWLGVSIVLIGIWAMTGFGVFWPAWAIFGMGVGALFNGIGLIRKSELLSERTIEREVTKLKGDPKQ